jgi:hypothetical protein
MVRVGAGNRRHERRSALSEYKRVVGDLSGAGWSDDGDGLGRSVYRYRLGFEEDLYAVPCHESLGSLQDKRASLVYIAGYEVR